MIDSEVEQIMRNDADEIAMLKEGRPGISDATALDKADAFMRQFDCFTRTDKAEHRILKIWIASAFLLDSKQPQTQLVIPAHD